MSDTWPKYKAIVLIMESDDPYWKHYKPRIESFTKFQFDSASIEPFFDAQGNPKVDRCKRLIEIWNKESEKLDAGYRYELVEEPAKLKPTNNPEYSVGNFW